ncbi:MAG: tRNA (adenosine(37)-N6)-threonylcarbamoyltransferase complex dimerization subunit type 1 TsaB [Bdellovibrionaceae bacterium]|nr:tRNA (adenosine(37)-N6)-threonylcarbamoyltransferase complex dimerization subunit type 1 TsaB [Pseudobdellovibrionaceae bacterium]
MKILALETSTGHGSVALIENDNVKFQMLSREQRSHSEIVHSYIEQGLSQLSWKISEIDLFATTIGPGSFTGIRVSINSAKSFSFVFSKPIVGVDSLLNLAHVNMPLLESSKEAKSITCMINAYKNMVYLGQYQLADGKLSVAIEPTVVRVQDLGTVIKSKTLVVGDGFVVYEPHLSDEVKPLSLRPIGVSDYPSADMTAKLAKHIWTENKSNSTFEWNLISPLYLRASEAEENKKGIKYTPL